MSERTSSKPGIADYVVARRKRKECFLDEIDRLIDWNPLEKFLRKTLKRVVNAVGNPAYPPLPMFKILLLQRWYNLSDTAVEEALYDRFSFVRFVGLSLDHDEVPDATTICRFRQSLVERNVQKRLLDYHATPANRSDTEEFVAVLDEVDSKAGESIFADKGYRSQLNRYVLQVRGLADGIMYKAARNRELTPSEKNANRQISSVPAKVERAFGTLKRGYGFHRARYLGRAKVELEFLLNAMAFNLKKAVLKAAC